MLPEFDVEFLKKLLHNARTPGPPEDEMYKPTAVFLLIFTKDSTPQILAVLKADNRDYLWRNQVALPGGHIDENDISPLSAAYRELEEELGISDDHVAYAGSLGHFQTIAHKDIEVFIGKWNGNRKHITFDPQEISKILEFPIPDLLKIHMSKNFHNREPDMSELTYPIQDVIIWGVTARIFHYFFELILQHKGISTGDLINP